MTLSVDAQANAQLSALLEKYALEGKDVSCYLEKLIQEKNLDYTDYLNLDTLLTLQKPRTEQPDEMIFITYHQIVELFFGLIIWELKQVTQDIEAPLEAEVFLEKIERVNRYFQILTSSFQVILEGLDKEQFQKFRFTLFPASGFQSFQYRMIELYFSDLKQLVSARCREEVKASTDYSFIFERLYWKRGMINPRTGAKNPTLIDFENRYQDFLYQHAISFRSRNVWQMFNRHFSSGPLTVNIIKTLRQLDEIINVHWMGLHYAVAMKHLTTDENTSIQSTGSSHWRKYLHPKFQKIILFPSLWNEEEINNWGDKELWMP